MSFPLLLEYCQSVALAEKFNRTEDGIYRSICQTYSKTFHTPLHLVFELDPVEVLTAYFTEWLDNRNLDEEEDVEELHELILGLIDPSYLDNKEDELNKYMKILAKEEKAKAKTKSKAKGTAPKVELPKSGGINLSYLEKEEKETGEF